jgi:PAS domain S-box-containing protein
VLARTFQGRTREQFARERGLSLPVGAAVATASLLIWQALLNERQTELGVAAKIAADNVRSHLLARMEARFRALDRLAKRWEHRGGTPQDEWEADAAAHIGQESGFLAIEWVDARLQPRWVSPAGTNVLALGTNRLDVLPQQPAIDEARDRRHPAVTRIFDLAGGGKGFGTYFPLYPKGGFDGFIVGIFRVDALLESFLSASDAIDYQIWVYKGEERLYGTISQTPEQTSSIQGESLLVFHGNDWQVMAAPKTEFVERTTSGLPNLVLCMGFALAGVVMISVRSVQQTFLKTLESDAANQDLGRQIEVRKQSEERLRESEERFRQAFEFAAVGMALVGLDGRWLRVNRALCELLGYPEKELLARTFQDITHPEDLDADLLQVRRLIAGADSHYQMEKRYFHRDGQIVWIRLTASLVRSRAGEPIYFVSQIENITERRLAEAVLRSDFRFLADTMPQIVWTSTPDGNLDYYNERWFDYTGLTLEQSKGWGWETVLHPEDVQNCHERWTRAFKTGGDFDVKYRFKRARDGTFRWHIGRAFPRRDPDGKIVKWVGTCTDIDDQKRAEEELEKSEHRLRAMTDNLSEGLVIASTEGQLVYWNETSRMMFGFHTIDEGLRKLPEFIDTFELSTLDGRLLEVREWPLSRVIAGETLHNFELRLRRLGTDRQFILSFSGAIVKAELGKSIAFLSFNDITERKQAEEELRLSEQGLREAHATLEQRVRERTAELQLVQAQLVERNALLEVETRRAHEANRMKSEFLANMSHELRTPLNGIIGFSSFLAGEKPGKLNDIQKEYLGDVLVSGRHLLRLINDLLDLAKIEAGKLELAPEPFSLRQAAAEVAGVLHPLMAEKHLDFQLQIELDDDVATLDPQKIKQVLYNLLSNAIKFTPERGRVGLRICPRGSEEIELSVSDTGIGIRQEDFVRLFADFQQLDSGSSRQYQGTGLGLALTKRILELHKGTIRVQSEFGSGTTFTVILPRVFKTA